MGSARPGKAMMPPSNWVERLFAEVQLGLLPYWQAVESRALILMMGVLVLAGLAWWTARVADHDTAVGSQPAG